MWLAFCWMLRQKQLMQRKPVKYLIFVFLFIFSVNSKTIDYNHKLFKKPFATKQLLNEINKKKKNFQFRLKLVGPSLFKD